MAAHLSTEHPDYSRDPLAIKFSSPGPDRIINSHMEFVAPAIQRMTHTNLLGDGRNQRTRIMTRAELFGFYSWLHSGILAET